MTAGECVRRADELRPNACGEQEKLRWVRETDLALRRDFMRRYEGGAAVTEGEWTAAIPLAASGPYEGLYLYRLLAQLELTDREWDSYNAFNALANQALSAFKKSWHRTHRLRRGGWGRVS